MKTCEQVTAEFLKDFNELLLKHGVTEFSAEDHYMGYPECGEDIRMEVTIPAVWDENNDMVRDYTVIDLGKVIFPEMK